ncbi:hypothetical protein CVT24_001695 [Panaeolus cyanescens]|uniref:F-box domain-containing protein n=1 Tax=Panaeolus cyanescens TaxID=181874 RepID=A0A409YFL2_9AGAR|nr:hypothetical protein CVT24_001695 [Panaeolus cyanescens]
MTIPIPEWYIPHQPPSPTRYERLKDAVLNVRHNEKLPPRICARLCALSPSSHLSDAPKTEWNVPLCPDIILSIVHDFLDDKDTRSLALVSRHLCHLLRPFIFQKVDFNFMTAIKTVRVQDRFESTRSARIHTLARLVARAPEILSFIKHLELTDSRYPTTASLVGVVGRALCTDTKPNAYASRFHDLCVESFEYLAKQDYPNLCTLSLIDDPVVMYAPDDSNIGQPPLPLPYWYFLQKIGPGLKTLRVAKADYPAAIFSFLPSLQHLHFPWPESYLHTPIGYKSHWRKKRYEREVPHLSELRTLEISDFTSQGKQTLKMLLNSFMAFDVHTLRVNLCRVGVLNRFLVPSPFKLTDLEIRQFYYTRDRDIDDDDRLPSLVQDPPICPGIMFDEPLDFRRLRILSLSRLSIILPGMPTHKHLSWLKHTLSTINPDKPLDQLKLSLSIDGATCDEQQPDHDHDLDAKPPFPSAAWRELDELGDWFGNLTIEIRGTYHARMSKAMRLEKKDKEAEVALAIDKCLPRLNGMDQVRIMILHH